MYRRWPRTCGLSVFHTPFAAQGDTSSVSSYNPRANSSGLRSSAARQESRNESVTKPTERYFAGLIPDEMPTYRC